MVIAVANATITVSPSPCTTVVHVGDTVTLTAQGSFSDGPATAWQWSQEGGPSASLSAPTAATTTFTPTQAETYQFACQVTGSNYGEPTTVTAGWWDCTNNLPQVATITVFEVAQPNPDVHNCDCNGEFPSDTLANIRARVLAALGFIDPALSGTRNTRPLSDLVVDLGQRLGFASTGTNYAPGVKDQLTGFLNEAQQLLFTRYELGNTGAGAPPLMAADSDTTTMDYVPVLNYALGLAKAHYGQGDAKINFDAVERYLANVAQRQPPNATQFLTEAIIGAQKSLYRAYPIFRIARWYSWSMTEGTRFYDVDSNEESCTKLFHPDKVEWVGISQDDDNWRALRCGIDPVNYSSDTEGVPWCYDIRQCIEVWPAPADDSWTLRIKGQFDLMTFAADTDTSTVDPHAIYLKALADAKAYYGQKDAALYLNELAEYIGQLTAASHLTHRYIPHGRASAPCTPWVKPKIEGVS